MEYKITFDKEKAFEDTYLARIVKIIEKNQRRDEDNSINWGHTLPELSDLLKHFKHRPEKEFLQRLIDKLESSFSNNSDINKLIQDKINYLKFEMNELK